MISNNTPQAVRRNLLLRNWESQNLSFLISSQSLNPSFLILGVFCQTKVLDRILNFAEAEGRNIFPKINKKDLSSRRICLPGQPLDWSWPSGQPLDRSGFGSFVKSVLRWSLQWLAVAGNSDHQSRVLLRPAHWLEQDCQSMPESLCFQRDRQPMPERPKQEAQETS